MSLQAHILSIRPRTEGDTRTTTTDRDTDEIAELIAQYEAVRQSGATNMWDRRGVAEVAECMDLDDLAEIARTDRGAYLRLLLRTGEFAEKEAAR